MQIHCERAQLLEPACFPLELAIGISQGPSGAKSCPMALSSPARVCLFLENHNQLPVLALPDLVLHLRLTLSFQLASPSASLTQASPRLWGTGCLCSRLKDMAPNFLHDLADPVK